MANDCRSAAAVLTCRVVAAARERLFQRGLVGVFVVLVLVLVIVIVIVEVIHRLGPVPAAAAAVSAWRRGSSGSSSRRPPAAAAPAPAASTGQASASRYWLHVAAC